MYKNDNDKKLAVLAVLFAFLIFTLVSCGKEMRELRGGARDIAERIYEHAGIDTRSMDEDEISSSESYILGIAEMHFLDKTEKVCIYRPTALSSDRILCVIEAKSESFANELFEEMNDNYEWAPCDPAESAVFMKYGKYIILCKDSAECVRAVAEAFDAETDGGAKTEFSQNPM
jgi:hypothetical protein